MILKLSFIAGITLLTGVNCTTASGQGGLTDTVTTEEVSKSQNLKTVKDNELFFEALRAKAHNDTKAAIDLLEKFVLVQPGNATAYYELSKLYVDKKKIEKAEENIKRAFAIVNDNKWYNDQYAIVLALQGKNEEAARVMAGMADKDPSDINYALGAAEYFEKAKKYDESLKYLDKASVRSGADEEIQLRKVQLYLHMNQVEQAGVVMKDLIARDPKNGKYYKILGELYDNNKMPDKALQVYLNAEKLVPGDPAIEMGLSEHYLNLKDTVKFRTYAKRAILNNKLDMETQMELFSVYAQSLSDTEQISQGLPIIRELLAQHPKNPLMIATYGEYLIQDRQLELGVSELKRSLALKAANFSVWQDLLIAYGDKKYADSLIKYSEKAIKLFPNQSLAHYFNGLGHYNKKEFPKAVKAINRSIDLLPETDAKGLAEMYSFLGDLYNTTKQYELSDSVFDKALEMVPGNASILNNYSYFLSERGTELDKAEEMSKKSLQLRPGEATFLDTYGWILYKKGKFEEAKDNIEKAVNANEQRADGTLYDHLGDVYFKLNDKVKAMQYWKKAKEKGAENPALDKKISEGKLYE
ncbi:MAG: tetratricopeptide repeat protein [Taibaiella sp.]|nr:tetratricopeptide repeat protein [Taibaiella sp.]